MPGKEEARVSAERGGAPIPAEQLRPNGLAKINVRGNAGAVLSPDADVNLSVGLISSETRLPGNAIFGAGSIGAGYRTAQDGWNGLYSRPGRSFRSATLNGRRTT